MGRSSAFSRLDPPRARLLLWSLGWIVGLGLGLVLISGSLAKCHATYRQGHHQDQGPRPRARHGW